MKLRIEKDFIDKITGKTHAEGSEVEFSEKRGDELLADKRKLVSLVKMPNTKKGG